MKLHVPEFVVEGSSLAETAAKVARHFGCIADGIVPDSGIAVAHIVETDPTPEEV